MRILIDITHPAHAHFFKNPIKILKNQGHEILITSRIKDNATDLLDSFGFSHTILTTAAKNKNIISFAKELIKRDYLLSKYVRKNKPDILAAIGGTFVAHTGVITNTRSIVFYDTENAKLQNLITYPFSSLVVVPECYESWIPKHTIKYRGYHELSYLHQDLFSVDTNKALKNAIDINKNNYFIRLVSWNANHDINEKGLSTELVEKIVEKLSSTGNVIISSESNLPSNLEKFSYRGKFEDIHHILSLCTAFIGESATMASEALALGTPYLYIANTSRGYINDQCRKYKISNKVEELDWATINHMIDETLSVSETVIKQDIDKYQSSTINVAAFVSETISSSK